MQEIKCESHDHLNKKFFKKQLVFSTSLEVLNPELPYIIKSGILHYDYGVKSYFLAVKNGTPEYYEMVMKAKEHGIELKTIGSYSYLVFEDKSHITFKNNVLFLPVSIVNSGRVYHLVQYNDEKEMNKTIIKSFVEFKEKFGPDAFILHEISEAEDIIKFMRKFFDEKEIYEIEIFYECDVGKKYIIKNNFSKDLSYNTYISFDGNVEYLTFDELDPGLKAIVGPIIEKYSGYNNPIYTEYICENKQCILRGIMEEIGLSLTLEGLNSIGEGLKFTITRLEKI